MSAIVSLRRYSRQRVKFPLFDLLAIAVVVIGRLDLGVAIRWPILIDVGLAFVVLWQLRLWDDLVDVEEDRAEHPDRVLVRAPDLGPYRYAVLGIFAVVFLWLTLRGVLAAGPRLAPILYTALILLLATWYESMRQRFSAPVLHYHAVLLKYPVLVYLLSPSEAVPWRAMIFAYLVACIYEVLHDRRLKRLKDARLAVGLEIATLTFGLFMLGKGLQS